MSSKSQTRYKQTEIGEIPEDWNIKPFGEVAYLSKEIFDPKKGGQDENPVYLGLEHFCEGGFALNGVGQSDELQSNKFRFVSGDVLFGKLRPYFKKVYSPKFDGVCSTDIWVLKAKQGVDQKFLYFLVGSNTFLNKAVESSEGTKMPRASWDFIANYEFSIPSLDEQQQIASILSSLDDKIELNRKMNRTLEEIGKALFKKWFVDFEFPNEEGKPYKSSGGKMVVSELGEIPEGWEVGKLSNFGKVVCGKTPPKSNSDFFGGETPFIKIPDMHGSTFIVKTEDKLSKKGRDFQQNKTLPKFSLCVSCIATVGLVSITSQESQTNQQINSVVPNNLKYLPNLYFQLELMKRKLIDYASGGSATPNLNTGDFENLPIISPEDKILSLFFTITWSLFEQILNNDLENVSLEQTRDSLLPRLTSGKLRVV